MRQSKMLAYPAKVSRTSARIYEVQFIDLPEANAHCAQRQYQV
jgi:hypothetical protein